jgi:dihydrofolate synthase/folylpolyglutamate synthase
MPTPPRTPEEALAFFSGLSPSTIRLGLDRIHGALERLGSPQKGYRTVHVAGTNGKGSTCAFVEASLRAEGYRVGLYTSPHLERVNERIRIDGEEITDAAFGQRILEVIERVPELCADPPLLTYFEVGTLVAFWHFAREAVEVAVLETGLGGRLDATNACVPTVTGVTQIDFDHMAMLGDTLDAIAREKAGIFKPGIPAIVAAQPPEAARALEEVAARVGAPLFREGVEFGGDSNPDGSLTLRGRRTVEAVTLSLRGPHQRHNAAVAAACLDALDAAGVKVSGRAVREGLSSARWPGRFEEVPGEVPTLVLDGAHNPAGVRALLESLDAIHRGRPIHLVFGVLADKDHRPMIETLFPRCATVELVPVDSPRALAPARYLSEAAKLAPVVRAHPNVGEALAAARKAASSTGRGLVVCAGSLVLIGQLKRWLRGENA